jgi:tetratricopeptide (TPR) repeat protein
MRKISSLSAVTTFQASGNFCKAIEGFNRVLSLQPRNAHAMFRRGVTWKQLGKYEDAAKDVKVAQSWEPGNAALRMPLCKKQPFFKMLDKLCACRDSLLKVHLI